MYIHIHIYIYIHIFIYSYIHIFMYSCIHVFMYSCIHVFMYSCIHIFITCLHTIKNRNISININTRNVHININIYIYIIIICIYIRNVLFRAFGVSGFGGTSGRHGTCKVSWHLQGCFGRFYMTARDKQLGIGAIVEGYRLIKAGAVLGNMDSLACSSRQIPAADSPLASDFIRRVVPCPLPSACRGSPPHHGRISLTATGKKCRSGF